MASVHARAGRARVPALGILGALPAIPAIVAVLGGLVALPAGAAAPVRRVGGVERVVNTNTMSQVHNPVAAWNAQGQAMVVWENDLLGLRGRLYDASGKPLSGEMDLVPNAAWSVLPGTAPVVFHLDPAIVFLPSGDFLLAWTRQAGKLEWTIFFEDFQVKSQEIVVQRFNVAGQAVGAATTISTPGASLKGNASLTLLPGGGGVLASWAGGPVSPPVAGQAGVYTCVLDAQGEPVAAPVQVDQTQAGWGTAMPALAFAADDGLLVAWDSWDIATSDTVVMARAFDPAGAPVGDAFSVSGNLAASPTTSRPTVAADGAGAYLLAFESTEQDFWHSQVLGQVIDESGNLVGAPTQISANVLGPAEGAPLLVPAGGGTFLAAWLVYDVSFPLGMGGVYVDATGAPTGAPMWINQSQINAQFRTDVATDGAGHWIAPYEGFVNDTTVGILARFF